MQRLGNEGGKFIQHLARTNRLPHVMNTLSFVTVVSGILLLYEVSGGFEPHWATSSHGVLLLAGGAFGIAAYLAGFLFIVPTVGRISDLGKQIAEKQVPPTPEQIQELGQLGKKMAAAQKWIASLLVLSLVFMSLIKHF